MNSFISARKCAEMKYLILVMLTLPFFLIACGGPKHMVMMDVKPPLVVKPDKAVLVIVRTTSFGGGVTIENYLDRKMIGQTKGKTYFITDVKPGKHYVMSHAENWAAARINFESGRIYFLDQGIYPGIWMARTGFTPLTAEEGLKQINESGCDYGVLNTQDPGEDMSEQDFNEVKADFEKEVRENPGRHKNTLEYKGYSKL